MRSTPPRRVRRPAEGWLAAAGKSRVELLRRPGAAWPSRLRSLRGAAHVLSSGTVNAQNTHSHARRPLVQQQRRRLQSRNGSARRAGRRDLRVPDHRGGLHRGGQGRRCGLCQGHEVQPGDDRGARQVPRHRARQRRRRLCRRGGRDREGHSGHQLPGYLHRGGRGPRHDAAAGDASPRHRAGPHGARGPLDRRAAAAPEGSAPDGTDARASSRSAGSRARWRSGQNRSGCA